MVVLLLVVAVVVVAYWALWFGHRSVVASESRPAYIEFENAFPLADAWLVVALLGSAHALWRRRPAALGWLLGKHFKCYEGIKRIVITCDGKLWSCSGI